MWPFGELVLTITPNGTQTLQLIFGFNIIAMMAYELQSTEWWIPYCPLIMLHDKFVCFDFLFLFPFMHLCSICFTFIDPTEVMSKFHHVHLNECTVVCYTYFHLGVSESGSNTVKSCIICLMIMANCPICIKPLLSHSKKSNVKYANQYFTWNASVSAPMILSIRKTLLISGIVACAFLKYFLWIILKTMIYFCVN